MKKLIIILVIIIIIIAGFSLFLNFYLLPVKGQAFVEAKASQYLNRETTIDGLSYSLKDGIVINKLLIRKKEADASGYVASAERISFNVLLLPLIAKGQVILTDLNIAEPYAYIRRNEDGSFNFSDILENKNSGSGKAAFDFLITSLNASGGQIIYDDLAAGAQTESLNQVALSFNYSAPVSVNFNASCIIENDQAFFSLGGSYNIKKNTASLKGGLEGLDLNRFHPYINMPIEVSEFKGELSSSYEARLHEDKTLILSASSTASELYIKTQTLDISGQTKIDTIVDFNLATRKFLLDKAELNLDGVEVEGVPYVESINDMRGKVDYSEEAITFSQLKAKVLGFNTVFDGKLNNKTLDLELAVDSKMNLNKLTSILPETQLERLRGIQIKGDSTVSLKITGNVRRLISLDLSGDIAFSDVYLQTADEQLKIDDIDGRLHLSKNSAALSDVSFNFKNREFNLEGSLQDYQQPVISLKLVSNDVFLEIAANVVENTAKITRLKGNYFTHTFEGTGQVSDLKQPVFTIYLDTEVDLGNLDKLMPKFKKTFEALEIKGKCPGKLHFEGELAKWKKAIAGYKGNCKQVIMKGLKIDDLYINTNMINEKINLNTFSFKTYEGNFAASGSMNIAPSKPTFNFILNLKNVNLAKLTEDTKLKDREITGTAYLECSLQNPLREESGPVIGQGKVYILEGHLLEAPVLSGLAGMIGLPQLEKVTFKESYADFIIQNRQISTDNLTLFGDELTVKSKGSVDFSGNLNFLTNAQIPEQTYEDISPGARIATIFVDVLGRYLIRVKTTGTIAEPLHKTVAVSPDEFIKEGLIKGIGDILKGL